MITPDDLIAQARTWLGVKFLHQGRTRHGADCLGYVAALLGELGSPMPLERLPKNYARAPQSELEAMLRSLCREIPLQPAALVLVKWPDTVHPSHAGIYTGANLIHCTAENGCVVEHGYRGVWVRRTVSVWALPLVRYECDAASGAPV